MGKAKKKGSDIGKRDVEKAVKKSVLDKAGDDASTPVSSLTPGKRDVDTKTLAGRNITTSPADDETAPGTFPRWLGYLLVIGVILWAAISIYSMGVLNPSTYGGVRVESMSDSSGRSTKSRSYDLYLPAGPRRPPSVPIQVIIGSEGTTPAPVSPESTPDAMRLEGLVDNPFIETSTDPLSTFAMDVDTGSYTIARAYLTRGQRPPPETVRTEEFINYFRQDYEPPDEGAFKINVDGAPSLFGAGLTLLRVGLQAQRIDTEERKAAVLTFVIDISGSMNSENRLGLVKQSLRLLVGELGPKDSVGIAVYGSEGREYLAHTVADKKDAILKAIDDLQSGGSTNAEQGLIVGYRMASAAYRPEAINRVILCSDGFANVGRTGPEEILKEIEKNKDGGITLSTAGFGIGDTNDYLMETLADKGDGNYAYVDSLAEAKRVFVTGLVGTLQVVAKDAKVQVEFDPEAVVRYRLLGYENRAVRDEDFRNDTVDAGEVGAGHRVTALYEVELSDNDSITLGAVRIRHLPPDGIGEAIEVTQWIPRADLASSFEDASPRFRFTAAVAELAELLRGSAHASNGSFEAVVDVARVAAGELDWDHEASQFVELVERAASIA